MISIISLIFQSTAYTKHLYDNLHKYTPELQTGEAEFYFIANDATPEVKKFLKENGYPHYINDNPKRTEQELFKMGYARPEYIHRVYRGYNYGMQISKNPILCLINSDNCFSPNWMKNLRAKLTHDVVVGTKVVQPYRFRSPKTGTFCEVLDCGRTLKAYNERKFLNFANKISEDSISEGNLFMPLMLYKEQAERVGYYPEGNLHNGEWMKVKHYGDHAFINKLEEVGIKHITCNNSIIYHFDEGEKKSKL